MPAFARELDRGIVQLHSSEYRNPAQLRPGGVLLVGAGNSGAEIALDVARAGHGRTSPGTAAGELPFRHRQPARPARTRAAPVPGGVLPRADGSTRRSGGRRSPGRRARATPLIRVKSRDLDADGVLRVPRTVGVRDGRPLLDDGRDARCDQRDLVHRISSPASRGSTCRCSTSAAMPVHTRGDHPAEPGLELRGAALPVRDVVVDDPRRGARRRVRGGADPGAGRCDREGERRTGGGGRVAEPGTVSRE